MSENTLLTPPAAEPAPVTTPGTPPVGGTVEQPIITPGVDINWDGSLNTDGTFTDKAYENGMPNHFKSIGAINESYKELQRVKGAPGSEATPEEVKAYRDSQSIPEVVNAETYGFQLPDELKEVYAPESLDRIAKAANDSAHLGHVGMMQAVVAEFGAMEVEGLGVQQQATEQQMAQQLQENAKQLEADPSFAGQNKQGALQTSANALNSALGALGVDSDSPEAQEVARSPLMVRILHHFGTKTSQDSVNLGNAGSDLRGGEEKANDIISNPANPLHAAYHAGDTIVGKKVLGLLA